MKGHLGRSTFAAAMASVALTSACGSTTQLPEAPATPPLTAAAVAVRLTGTAPVAIVPGSITYKLDDSGSLVINLSVKSNAKRPVTMEMRASLYDAAGTIVGDATGGQVGVAPGATAVLELNGPRPNGEIVSATFEGTSLPLPGAT
jgi:hypothetical protein